MSIRINFLFDDFCYMLFGERFEAAVSNDKVLDEFIGAYWMTQKVANKIEAWLDERAIK